MINLIMQNYSCREGRLLQFGGRELYNFRKCERAGKEETYQSLVMQLEKKAVCGTCFFSSKYCCGCKNTSIKGRSGV